MAEVIVFRDAVQVILDWLGTALPAHGETAQLHKNIPITRPARFVRALRTGGPRHNMVVDAAQVTVECWADTDAEAQDLAQLVRGVINAMPLDRVCYRIDEVGGPADLPDPDSNQSRTTWSVLVYLRGAAL